MPWLKLSIFVLGTRLAFESLTVSPEGVNDVFEGGEQARKKRLKRGIKKNKNRFINQFIIFYQPQRYGINS